MAYVEITHSLNLNREMGKALIRVEDIIGIKEEETETKKLYDEDGNLVSEEPKDKLFAVLVANDLGCKTKLYINENEYTRLSQILLA